MPWTLVDGGNTVTEAFQLRMDKQLMAGNEVVDGAFEEVSE